MRNKFNVAEVLRLSTGILLVTDESRSEYYRVYYGKGSGSSVTKGYGLGKQSRGVLMSSAAYDYTLDEQEVKFDSYGYFSLVVTNGDGKTETLKCLTYTTLTPKIMNSAEKNEQQRVKPADILPQRGGLGEVQRDA